MPLHLATDRRGSLVRIGMCSVTLRADTADAVINKARRAGLESIEWGSDVHVPAGDLVNAEAVGAATQAAGLVVCSYGSYLGSPWQVEKPESVTDVLNTAIALGAPRVRVWAGPCASARADRSARDLAIAELRHWIDLADERSIELAFEFHLGTLTDTATSTLELLEAVDFRAGVYWQPRVGVSDDEALADLNALSDNVSTVHAFSWEPKFDRHQLKSRAELWRAVLQTVDKLPSVTDVLIEFLPGDDSGLLRGEAQQLLRWRAETHEVPR